MAQKGITKSYDQEFNAQAVKLAQEIGGHKAAEELGVPSGTIYAWVKAFKEGRLDAKAAAHAPNNALSLNEELMELRKRIRDQDKEIRRPYIVMTAPRFGYLNLFLAQNVMSINTASCSILSPVSSE